MRTNATCTVVENRVYRNDKLVFEASSMDSLTKEWYDFLQVNYPKFYKMDSLCKLTFLSVLQLTDGQPLPSNTAQCFTNAGFSLESDSKHIDNIVSRGMASPAVFVYTLPNIAMGELSIFHKWNGENLFYASEAFDEADWLQEAKRMIVLKNAPHVIGGWVESHPQSVNVSWVSAE